MTTNIAPIDPTPEDIAQIRLMAVNDRTRKFGEHGIRLSHDEADEIGEVALDWLRDRFDLRLVTDDRGTMLLPRAS